MPLPRDPFEVTIEQLIEADTAELRECEARLQEAEEQLQRLQELIAAHQLALQAYWNHRVVKDAP